MFIGKTQRLEKLSISEQEDLLADFLTAFELIRNAEEAALFVRDLFTRSEVKIFSKRLRIAKLLLANKTYEEIEKEVHASHATVAKVAAWLLEKGEGFRRVIQKLPKHMKKEADWLEAKVEWSRLMHRYPGYFWPQLLIEELNKQGDQKARSRIRSVLTQLDEKKKVSKEIEEAFAPPFRRQKKYNTT